MASLRYRRATFMVFFLGLVPVSAFLYYLVIRDPLASLIHTAGAALIVTSALFAFYVHRLSPPKHETPKDFQHFLTDGLYRYVRHPFYSAFILLGFGVALYFVSIPGLLFNSPAYWEMEQAGCIGGGRLVGILG